MRDYLHADITHILSKVASIEQVWFELFSHISNFFNNFFQFHSNHYKVIITQQKILLKDATQKLESCQVKLDQSQDEVKQLQSQLDSMRQQLQQLNSGGASRSSLMVVQENQPSSSFAQDVFAQNLFGRSSSKSSLFGGSQGGANNNNNGIGGSISPFSRGSFSGGIGSSKHFQHSVPISVNNNTSPRNPSPFSVVQKYQQRQQQEQESVLQNYITAAPPMSPRITPLAQQAAAAQRLMQNKGEVLESVNPISRASSPLVRPHPIPSKPSPVNTPVIQAPATPQKDKLQALLNTPVQRRRISKLDGKLFCWFFFLV